MDYLMQLLDADPKIGKNEIQYQKFEIPEMCHSCFNRPAKQLKWKFQR